MKLAWIIWARKMGAWKEKKHYLWSHFFEHAEIINSTNHIFLLQLEKTKLQV